ncbi:hypothetical protein NPIL_71011 [Nephila pilipes]|uniref:Uncharacterized protein n=1 Tax=Nephila pilipes TaxID=299642 RepID=A0A8X6MUN6_NEPPI|nr:hypothetical protein NPIL_71011 [Nephila pilipes]
MIRRDIHNSSGKQTTSLNHAFREVQPPSHPRFIKDARKQKKLLEDTKLLSVAIIVPSLSSVEEIFFRAMKIEKESETDYLLGIAKENLFCKHKLSLLSIQSKGDNFVMLWIIM